MTLAAWLRLMADALHSSIVAKSSMDSAFPVRKGQLKTFAHVGRNAHTTILASRLKTVHARTDMLVGMIAGQSKAARLLSYAASAVSHAAHCVLDWDALATSSNRDARTTHWKGAHVKAEARATNINTAAMATGRSGARRGMSEEERGREGR